ncbi:MAG TPA: hypothetical protein VKZ44_05500 [Taishania sp.]|nr:hypothetical protein [Taishania sp.]
MRLSIILPIILLVNYSFSQEFGYYGKKNSISISANLSPKFISNALVGFAQPINAKGYKVGYGFTASYDRQLNANKFIGVEFSMNYGSSKLKGDAEMYYYDNSFTSGQIVSKLSNVSPIGYRVLNPCITFSAAYKGHIAPIGIVNTIGFGALILNVVDTPISYNQGISTYDNYPVTTGALPTWIKNRGIEPEVYGSKLFGARVFWQTALNVPIVKGIMWSVSARANLNIYSNLLIQRSSSSDYHIEYNDTRSMIAKTELLNVFQLNTGLKFVF